MSVTGYSQAQIRLHWAVVVLLVLQYALSGGIAAAFEQGVQAGTMRLTPGAIAHMAGGSLILLLAFWRLALRQERGAPPPPEADPAWQKALARGTHVAIYALLILLPVTGGVAWGTASAGAAVVHGALKSVLLLCIALHVAGALYGHFVQKSGVLARMMRPEG